MSRLHSSSKLLPGQQAPGLLVLLYQPELQPPLAQLPAGFEPATWALKVRSMAGLRHPAGFGIATMGQKAAGDLNGIALLTTQPLQPRTTEGGIRTPGSYRNNMTKEHPPTAPNAIFCFQLSPKIRGNRRQACQPQTKPRRGNRTRETARGAILSTKRSNARLTAPEPKGAGRGGMRPRKRRAASRSATTPGGQPSSSCRQFLNVSHVIFILE